MKKNDREFLSSFFNDNGYVLDFSDYTFNRFTLNSIGISLKEKYGLSKGRSLAAYVYEASTKDIVTLFTDLINYAERNDMFDTNKKSFKQMKILIEGYRSNNSFTKDMSVQVEQSFNDDFIENQLKIMIEMVERSPTDAIGKAKELVESCFKYILDFKGISYSKNDDLGNLRKLTFLELNIDSNTNVDATVNNNIKKLLSSLNQIVSSIGELRNIKGNGHGKGIGYIELTPSYAKLAINTSLTIVHFVWDIYKEQIGD